MDPHLSFDSVLERYPWTPIRGCPGRYVLKQMARDVSPCELVGTRSRAVEYSVEITPDRVLVIQFEGGGLLSYGKADGSYVHTLNTTAGLLRRLQRFGIELSD